MKKATKILLLVLCAILLVVGSVAGTLAYLTSQADVTNTFTVGQVNITLQEKAMNPETGKQQQNGDPVSKIENIKLVPGREIEKEPFITVGDNSENCWLFVKVENELAAAGDITWVNGWSNISDENGNATEYWAYSTEAKAKDVVTVFTAFTCDSDLKYDALEALEGKSIKITAYAIQSEGIDAEDAWTSLSDQLSLS